MPPGWWFGGHNHRLKSSHWHFPRSQIPPPTPQEYRCYHLGSQFFFVVRQNKESEMGLCFDSISLIFHHIPKNKITESHTNTPSANRQCKRSLRRIPTWPLILLTLSPPYSLLCIINHHVEKSLIRKWEHNRRFWYFLMGCRNRITTSDSLWRLPLTC